MKLEHTQARRDVKSDRRSAACIMTTNFPATVCIVLVFDLGAIQGGKCCWKISNGWDQVGGKEPLAALNARTCREGHRGGGRVNAEAFRLAPFQLHTP